MDACTTKAYGTFSFTFAAEWDYVTKSQINDYCRNNYSIQLDKRLDMKKAVQLLLESGNWRPYEAVEDIAQKKLFPAEQKNTKAPLYNEYLYFNSHMRRVIYNQTEYNEQQYSDYSKAVAARGDSVVVFEWTPEHCDKQKEETVTYAYYLYRYLDNLKMKKYILPISSIELRLYTVGVMLITIRCQNEELTQEKYSCHTWCRSCGEASPKANVCNADDLSWIENCGRRLFASRTVKANQNLSSFFNDHPVFSVIAPLQEGEESSSYPWRLAPDAPPSLRHMITLCDFRTLLYGKSITEICTQPEHFDFVRELISERCIAKAKLKALSDSPKSSLLVLDSYNDDRMYLHGTIESKTIANLTKTGWQNRNEAIAAEQLNSWYGILYGDAGWDASCQDPQMLIASVEAATESRWVNYATFHGMTYHSMVMLLGCVADAPYLVSNNDWIYLQMFLIAVLQRCAVQRFYREASGLLQYHARKIDEFCSAVQDKYTLFLNQFWFYEVTEQEQGKSMFKKLQAAMNIKEDVEFLDTALEELNQQTENRMASMINKLLVPMSILGGFWAFTEMGLRLRDALSGWIKDINPVPAPWGDVIALGLFGCIAIGLTVYFINQFKYWWRRIFTPCHKRWKAKRVSRK